MVACESGWYSLVGKLPRFPELSTIKKKPQSSKRVGDLDNEREQRVVIPLQSAKF